MRKVILGICEEDERDDFEDEDISQESQIKFSSFFSLEQNTKKRANDLLDSSFNTKHKNIPINYGVFYHSHRKIVEDIIKQEDKIHVNEILLKQVKDKKEIKKLRREIIKAKDRLYEFFYILQSAHQNYSFSNNDSLDGEKQAEEIVFDYHFSDDDYYYDYGIDGNNIGKRNHHINYMNLTEQEKAVLIEIDKLGKRTQIFYLLLERRKDEGDAEKARKLLDRIEELSLKQERLMQKFITQHYTKNKISPK